MVQLDALLLGPHNLSSSASNILQCDILNASVFSRWFATWTVAFHNVRTYWRNSFGGRRRPRTCDRSVIQCNGEFTTSQVVSIFDILWFTQNGCAIGPMFMAPFLGLAIYGFDFAADIPDLMNAAMKLSFIRGGVVSLVLTVFGYNRHVLECSEV